MELVEPQIGGSIRRQRVGRGKERPARIIEPEEGYRLGVFRKIAVAIEPVDPAGDCSASMRMKFERCVARAIAASTGFDAPDAGTGMGGLVGLALGRNVCDSCRKAPAIPGRAPNAIE